MKYEDVPKKESAWIKELKHGDPFIEDHVREEIHLALDITDLKTSIISKMTELMTECAHVIQHANAMKKDRICTCKEKHGDKP